MKNKMFIFLLCITATLGCIPEEKKIVDNTFRDSVIAAFEKVEKTVFKNEQVIVPPKNDKCPCNGTGYIVHGDGHKTECPRGDNCDFAKKNKKTEKAVGENKEHGVIYLYTRDNCVFCKKWKMIVMPQLLKQGWKIREVYNDTDPVPFFNVKMNGESNIFKGYMSIDDLNKINNKYLK